ncbi:MAG: mycofactocin-associated electron transfer flavoprotein alpha subunit [Microthrixaceae bacterium]
MSAEPSGEVLAELPRVAVLAVRNGVVPVGGPETVAEAGGAVVLVGTGLAQATEALDGAATQVFAAEWRSPWSSAAACGALAPHLGSVPIVLLPATPDGRDLAPHLALALQRPLYAGALRVADGQVVQARHGGRSHLATAVGGPLVATLQPGVRSVPHGVEPTSGPVELPLAVPADRAEDSVELVAIHPPDTSTMDLSEAASIVGGGAGLGGAEEFELLARVAEALGASVGATRVVTDQGTLGHERQIGTTGVVVSPIRYLALGISGAVQHTAGLGNPDLVVSVNTDPHAPMMAMADLALTADAPATLRALAAALGVAATSDELTIGDADADVDAAADVGVLADGSP